MLLQDLDGLVQGAGTLRLVHAWRRWRGDRALPLKSLMDLRDVRDFLPWLGLFELGDTDTIRARLAGTALRGIYGADMTGRNLKEITCREHWPLRNARCRSMITKPCGGLYICVKPLAEEGSCAVYETVSLPLDVDAAAGVRHVLYCIARLPDAAAGAPGRRRRAAGPVRFDFVDIGAGTPDLG